MMTMNGNEVSFTTTAVQSATAALRRAERLVAQRTQVERRAILAAIAAGAWRVESDERIIETALDKTVDAFVADFSLTEEDLEAGVEVELDASTGPRVRVEDGISIPATLRILARRAPGWTVVDDGWLNGVKLADGRTSYPLAQAGGAA